MKKITRILVALTVILLMFACKEGQKTKYLPESTGAVNSVVVVMDNNLWKGPVGDKVREHFAQPVLGLTWEEPMFTINHLPTAVFSGAVRNSRSILYVQEDTLNRAHIKTDMFARPQKIGVIKGRDEEELLSNVDATAKDIIAAFKALEIKEAQNRFTRSLNKDTSLQEKFGISLSLPSAYTVGKVEDNFVWIDRQIPKGHMNIIVYTMPGNSFATDSTFVRDIVAMRDSIGRQYIPGPDIQGKETYPITEKAFAPYISPAEISGLKGVEVRGIWEMVNYPMAGPFVTYIINDKANDRKLVLEGFVFAPSTEKRDYMFELEAILKSLSLDPKDAAVKAAL